MCILVILTAVESYADISVDCLKTWGQIRDDGAIVVWTIFNHWSIYICVRKKPFVVASCHNVFRGIGKISVIKLVGL